MDESPATTRIGERSPLAAVTRGIVQPHSQYFGKGPTRARTDRIGDDGLVCVLRDTLTSVEVTLTDRGRGAEVLTLRRAFQDAMASEFIRVVEEATDRKVLAFLSQAHLDPDIATEFFFLDPLLPPGRDQDPRRPA
jgi:uncharacterized protein YbcI